MTQARVNLLKRLSMMHFFDDQSFLCAVDSSGYVFAHFNPDMIGMYQGDQYLETAEGRRPYIGEAYLIEGIWDNEAASTIEIVSTLLDPDTQITIAVHQNKTIVDQQIGTIQMYFIVTSVIIFGALFIIGLAVTQRIIERHLDEIQHAEAALHEAKNTAEAANRAKSDFLARMSHELRTPLNGILGYAQLMKRDPRLTESHKEGANIIQRSGEHLLELINDVLDLSKIEARRMELRETEVRLQQMLTGIVDLFTIRAEQKGLRFRFESSNAHPVGIWADEQKIRQVLINLLGNAVKFTRSGEVRLVVTALETVSAERITLRFCVEDTGIGIDATQLETIFQPFSRIEQKDSTSEGTGLGLSISHEFVRMMDSDLKVKSRPEEGTAFWFDITCPLVACPDSPETMVHQGPVTGYAGPPKSILVVDDAADNRRVIVDALHPLGFKMYEAENRAEGLRIAREKVPDLMLVDLIMPDQDGFETVRQVKQASELKLMAILALSASVSEESRRDSLEAGCDDFIPKPVAFDTLMDAIRKALDLVWQSDGEEAPSLSTAEATTSSPTQPMIMPPLTDIETLHKLAVVGDIQHLLRALDRIASEPTYHTFTDTILGLTKTYDLKQIRTLLEAHV
jgi:signal transduction histidine kinase/DNA-binding NarL/FixJ family response regulator